MFGKVKRWLGIEGVKVEIITAEHFSLKERVLAGKLRFVSMNNQTVTEVNLRLIERYKRGRGSTKLIDEYCLGEIYLKDQFEVIPDEETFIHFSLPFTPKLSRMDELEQRNFLIKGVVGAAKLLKGVKSEFRLEVRATVKGTALHPVATRFLRAEK
jgi:hypothetical protein